MTTEMTEQQWQAILTNDRTFDPFFLYGVDSTKIFCRPSCKSPQPKRKNVRLFANATEAIEAGYRACKRCKPCALYAPDEEWVEAMKKMIHQYYDERLTLERMAFSCHGSPSHLQRVFKQIMGVSPVQYLQQVRLAHAQQALVETSLTVAEIGKNVGFQNSSYFSTLFKKQTGFTPKQFRLQSVEKIRNGKDERG